MIALPARPLPDPPGGTAIRTSPVVPAWLPAALLGPLVAVLGAWEATEGFTVLESWNRDQLLVALATALAVSTYRVAPAVGLVIVWVLLPVHLLQPVEVLKIELSVAVLAYGLARHGNWLTVVASALSVPGAAFVAYVLTVGYGRRPLVDGLYADITGIGTVSDAVRALGLLAFIVLAVPWLLGLLLRATSRAGAARAEREVAEQAQAAAEIDRARAEEIARLREGQTQLARDVHDVVGHSLAVILAQAESAQFLPDDDPARLKTTFATIAGSARESLQSVRRVLSSTGEETVEGGIPAGGLDSLVDGVRTAGHPVDSEVHGTVRPLPPELDVVAFRVLQEMLTNALKHGRRGSLVRVRRHWFDQLTIEVTNEMEPSTADAPTTPGQGLDGMRRRLEAVGGRLEVQTGADTFTVSATMPLRAAETGR